MSGQRLSSSDPLTGLILERVRSSRRGVRKQGRLPIGQCVDMSLPVGMPGPREDAHTIVEGGSGGGKSYALELMMGHWLWMHKNLNQVAPSFILIDPHGTLYERTLRRIVEFGIPAEKVLLIELDADGPDVRYPAIQPLSGKHSSVSYQTSAFRSACVKCWGQDSLEQTPRLARWLKNAIWPLVEANVSLAELEHMLSLADDEPVREAILRLCKNDTVRRAWREEFAAYRSVTQKMDQLGSSLNRLEPFYEQPTLRRLLGQTNPTKVIDWRRVVDNGTIVLVKLFGGTQVHDTEANLVGTLLINDVIRAVKRPPIRTDQRACYVVIDELQKTLSPDHLEICRETRKLRLYFVAATQEPSAVREYNEELYLSLMTNCTVKVVFGGVPCEVLMPIVRDAFARVADPDAVKFDLERTYFEPIESVRRVHASSISEGRSFSESEGEGASSGWSSAALTSHSNGESVSMGIVDGLLVTTPTGFGSDGTSTGSMHSRGFGKSGGASEFRGRSQAFGYNATESTTDVPFYELHRRTELSSRTFRSLDEQLQIAVNRVHALQRQHALVAISGEAPRIVKILDVPDANVSEAEVADYRAQVMEGVHYASAKEIDAEIAARKRRLLESLKPAIVVPTSKSAAPSAPSLKDGLERELDQLEWADQTALRTYLNKLKDLTASARRPLIDRLAMRSGKARSHFTSLMRGRCNGTRTT